MVTALLVSALLLAGCADKPVPSAAQQETEAAAPAPVPTNANIGDGSDKPLTAIVVSALYTTESTPVVARSRCGEQLVVAPIATGWFRSKPSPDGDIPPPVIQPSATCDQIAERQVEKARYRVVYLFEGEEYSVDLDQNPGATVTVDHAGRIVRPAPHP